MADLIERIGRTAGSVGERGKTWLEITRLKNDLEQAQRQRDELVLRLGEQAYQHMRAGSLSAQPLAAAFGQVQEADQQVSLLRQQIAALESPAAGGPTCPACGNANAAGDRFCVSCGSPLAAPAPALPRCGSCGAEVKPQARFCVGCGAPTA
jgi:hypothetical protein